MPSTIRRPAGRRPSRRARPEARRGRRSIPTRFLAGRRRHVPTANDCQPATRTAHRSRACAARNAATSSFMSTSAPLLRFSLRPRSNHVGNAIGPFGPTTAGGPAPGDLHLADGCRLGAKRCITGSRRLPKEMRSEPSKTPGPVPGLLRRCRALRDTTRARRIRAGWRAAAGHRVRNARRSAADCPSVPERSPGYWRDHR